MRTLLAAIIATGTLLSGGFGTATAASKPIATDVTIVKKVPFEIQDPQFSQVAVTLNVVCDPNVGALALNVQVFQNSVAGFGFVPSVACTGKKETVVAHVQSNFGSVYSQGRALAVVTDFAHPGANQFSGDVSIQ